jgi:basic membrane protein A and related proteins
MFNKKIISLLAAVMMVATVFVGCGSNDKATENKEGTKVENKEEKAEESKDDVEKKIFIGLSTDEGGINDKSFNQSANAGITKAQDEFKVEYKYLEPDSKEDYEENLELLVDEGADLVFGVGFQMADAVKAAAENHTDSKFAIIDSVVELPNVQSIGFKEQEGSFLMGVIAGKMTKTNKVGFIGGKDFELINRFEVGFAAGVKAVNPEAAEALISRKSVKYADSFGDVNKGFELAKALYDEGCDIVYHAAGGVGIGLFDATKKERESGNEVWAIGVDMDQAVTLPEYKDVILSSMIKRVDVGTYNAVKDVKDNKFQGGNVTVLGLAEDGVGIADTTKDNTPEEFIQLAEKYKEAIVKGDFVVPATLDELSKFEVPEVK